MGLGHEEERPEDVDDAADGENEEGGVERDPSFIQKLQRERERGGEEEGEVIYSMYESFLHLF